MKHPQPVVGLEAEQASVGVFWLLSVHSRGIMIGNRHLSIRQLCSSIAEDCKILGDTDRHVSTAAPIGRAGPDVVTHCSSSAEAGLLMIGDPGALVTSRHAVGRR